MKHFHAIAVILMATALLFSCSSNKKRDVNLNPTCIEDLAGTRVVYPMGNLYFDWFDAHPGFCVGIISDGTDMLLNLQIGKADFGIIDSLEEYALHLEKYGLEAKFSGFLKHEYPMIFAKHVPELCEKFNAFLKEFRESGELDYLGYRWFGPVDSLHRLDDSVRLPTDGRKMIIAVSVARYPYTYFTESGPSGYQVDLMNHFSEWSGIVIEYKSMDYTAITQAMALKQIDCTMIPFDKTEEREKVVLFSDPYITDCGTIVGRISGDIKRPPIWQRVKTSVVDNLIVENRWVMMARGLWQTVLISFWSIIMATITGALLCAMHLSRRRWVARLSNIIVELVRGLPLMIILMIIFYVIFSSDDDKPLTMTVTAFAIYFGAYFSESFRTGIISIDIGQKEASLALGMKPAAAFMRIVLPQALLRIIPVYKGLVSTLIKSTSIVGYVAVIDITKASEHIRSLTHDAFFPLILSAAIYLLLSWLANMSLDAIERKITPKHRETL